MAEPIYFSYVDLAVDEIAYAMILEFLMRRVRGGESNYCSCCGSVLCQSPR